MENRGIYLCNCMKMKSAIPTSWSMIVSTLRLCQTARWLMTAVPVHEPLVPFTSWHLITVISLGTSVHREPPTTFWRYSIPYSSFRLPMSWAAHSSAPFEVSLVHPPWNYLISSLMYQLLGRVVCHHLQPLGSLCSEWLWTQLVSCRCIGSHAKLLSSCAPSCSRSKSQSQLVSGHRYTLKSYNLT